MALIRNKSRKGQEQIMTMCLFCASASRSQDIHKRCFQSLYVNSLCKEDADCILCYRKRNEGGGEMTALTRLLLDSDVFNKTPSTGVFCLCFP